MLYAAGTALPLVADGTVIAFGRLASTLRREHRHVYDGDRFEEERAFLFGVGVPVKFIPSARDLGRTDLA